MMRKTMLARAVFGAIEQQRYEAATARLRDMRQQLKEIENPSAGSVVAMARRPGKTRLHRLWMKLRGMM